MTELKCIRQQMSNLYQFVALASILPSLFKNKIASYFVVQSNFSRKYQTSI